MRDPIAPVLGRVTDAAPIVETAERGPLIDLLFTPRVTWSEPATAAELAALIGVPTALASALWLGRDDGSGQLADEIGGISLYPDDSSAILEAPAFGFFDGRGMLSFIAAENVGVSFLATSAAEFEPGAGDFGLLVVFRATQRPSAQRGLVGKASAAHAAGYGLYLESTGNLTWRVRGAGGDRTVTLAANHADGAWHFAALYKSGAAIGAYSDQVAEGTAGATGDIATAADVFAVGSPRTDLAPTTAQHKLVTYLPGAAGAALAGQRAALLAWWAAHVSGWTLVKPTFTRASALGSTIGAHPDGGIALGIAGAGAPAWRWMPGDDGDFGIQLAPAFTSIVTHSDPADAAWSRLDSAQAGWSISALCPRGTKTATEISKIAGHPEGRLSIGVPMTSGLIYHFAIAVWWDGAGPGTLGVDAGPSLRIRDAADAATLAEIGTSVVGAWHWLILPPFTAPSTDTFKLQLLPSADSFDTTGAVLFAYATGGLGGSWQPFPGLAAGAGAASVATAIAYSAVDSGLIGRADHGELEVTAQGDGMYTGTLPAERGLGSVSGGGLASRRLSVTAARALRGLVTDGGGATDVDLASAAQAAATLAAIHRWRLRWERGGGLDGGSNTVEVGNEDGGIAASATAIDAAGDPDTMTIGATSAGVPWLGGIARVRVWAWP